MPRMERGGRALFRRIKTKQNPGLFQGQTAHKRVPGVLFCGAGRSQWAGRTNAAGQDAERPEYIPRKCIKYEYILQITHKDTK